MARHQVVLVPGFFGFGKFGELKYFVGVREALELSFANLGFDAEITEVSTLPTASIRYRAARIVEVLADVAERDIGPIHVIGHSTGGLDARLAIAPTASLPSTARFEHHDRIQSLVTVATPHFGTPLATFFSSRMGKPLLRLLAILGIYALKRGRLSLGLALEIGRVFTRLDDFAGQRGTLLDQLYAQLLDDFTETKRQEIIEFLLGVAGDQSLVFQLTPAACDVLNASTADPDRVRYGSVTTLGSPGRLPDGLSAAGRRLLYAFLYSMSARSEPNELPPPAPEQAACLKEAYGRSPESDDNDGIVPTLSQVWGSVIHCAKADHADVLGHFGPEVVNHTDSDWLPSDSGFGEAQFRALWADVARFITLEASARPSPRQGVQPGVERTQLPNAP